jgi:GTP-binding protein EngB required for normal cell division
MHDQLVDVLDRVDSTLARSHGLVPAAALDRTALATRRIRNRLDFPLDMAIVALAGGTGSGKSSLFNAILGGDPAEVGGIRPTTSRALVSLPRQRSREIAGYVSRFGDLEVVNHDGFPWLVLIDLPDTDSVEVDHRIGVEALLPLVDAVIWVVDVEKYRDQSLHHGFLRNLTHYESQFVFVVNQIDRIPQAEVSALSGDFADALAEDGYRSPRVYPTSAGTGIAQSKGIDQLVSHLQLRADGFALERMLADLDRAVEDLANLLGNGSVQLERAWETTLDEVIELVKRGESVAASRLIAAFFERLADNLSGDGAEVVMAISAHAGETMSRVNQDAMTEVPAQMVKEAGQRWGRPTKIDAAIGERLVWVRARLEETTFEQVKPFLHDRGVARAHLAELAIEVAALRPAADG